MRSPAERSDAGIGGPEEKWFPGFRFAASGLQKNPFKGETCSTRF